MTRLPNYRLWCRFIALTGVTFAASSCAGEATAQPSLIPSLEATQPVLVCLDAAATIEKKDDCVAQLGIDKTYRLPLQPKTHEDYSRTAILSWHYMTSGLTGSISQQQFSSAISYAQCMEKQALALGGIKVQGDPRVSIAKAYTGVEAACAHHPLSMASSFRQILDNSEVDTPKMDEQKVSAIYLARIFGNLAFDFAVETSGWVTDGMRQCYYFANRGYSSDYCARRWGENGPMVPPPAPPAIPTPRVLNSND